MVLHLSAPIFNDLLSCHVLLLEGDVALEHHLILLFLVLFEFAAVVLVFLVVDLAAENLKFVPVLIDSLLVVFVLFQQLFDFDLSLTSHLVFNLVRAVNRLCVLDFHGELAVPFVHLGEVGAAVRGLFNLDRFLASLLRTLLFNLENPLEFVHLTFNL